MEKTMCNLIQRTAFGAALALAGPVAHARAADGKPTIVLVNGAFAESSSWNRVIAELNRDGYRTIAVANPLRGVKADAAVVSAVVASIEGSVVLVGHSYGGPVTAEAANGRINVKAPVYVGAFAPDTGESSLMLSARFPGSTQGDALVTVDLPGGEQDLYISMKKFHDQLAGDVPAPEARPLAVTRRPVAAAAQAEPSTASAWRTIPSYAVYGSNERSIPLAAMQFMAERARSTKTVVVEGASNPLIISRPDDVASFIKDAATVR
jgi:pimeloyl-ACP methyl ester carboxylesterase